MWETPLDKVIRLEDGRTIKTLADARDVILGLPEQEQQRPQWQALAGLLVSAVNSENPDLLAIASTRLEVMLQRLAETAKKPPTLSVRVPVRRPGAKLLK
jgi:hypothetical protein